MKRGLLFLVLLLVARAALADGMAFMSGSVPDDVYLTKQRAIVKWEDGLETIIVGSDLNGPTGDYNWVIPVPNRPSFLKASRPGYLQAAFFQATPPIESYVEPINPVAVMITVVVMLAMAVTAFALRKETLAKRLELVSWTAPSALLLLVIAWFMIPNESGFAKSADSVGGGIDSLGDVGSYEVHLISGTKGSEARDWLLKHGTRLPQAAERVIDAYMREGWSLIAAEIKKDFVGPFPPHPIKIVFPSQKPIYPMRLTGTQNKPLQLELIVIGKRGAQIDGMETWGSHDKGLRIQRPYDPELNATTEPWTDSDYDLAKFGSRITFLRGALTNEQMQRDFEIHWTDAPNFRLDLMTPRAASHTYVKRIAAGICLGLAVYAFGLLFFPTRSLLIFVLSLAFIPILGAIVTMATFHPSIIKAGPVREGPLDEWIYAAGARRSTVWKEVPIAQRSP